MNQGLLFELPAPVVTLESGAKYWIPESENVDAPLCWDCKHWPQNVNDLGPRRCKVARIEVDFRGTCGAHEYRSLEVKAQAEEWRRNYLAGSRKKY